MKEQIQQLIAEGRTEEALALLAQHSSDALLLQARYNNGKKQYNMGLIEFSEWQRTQAQINYAALELSNSVKGGPVPVPAPANPVQVNPTTAPQPKAAEHSVFISYNHQDREYADKIYAFLKKEGLDVIIDDIHMVVGDRIKDFILEQIKNNNVVLSLVSKNSLKSGWVGLESDLALYSQLLTDKKFIPVMIDNAVFDGDFYFHVIEEIDSKISDLDQKIEKARKLNIGYNQFETQRKRIVEQRNNLSNLIDHFQNVFVEDISSENKFIEGMARVIRSIKSN